MFIKTCETKQDALNTLIPYGNFSFYRKIEQVNGDIKYFYRCNKVKKRGTQCPVSAFLQYLADSTKINVFKSVSNEHIHENATLEIVTNEIVDAIKKLVEVRVKTPRVIQRYIENNLQKKTNNLPN